MQFTRSKQELVIASLFLALGVIFLASVWIEPFSPKNLLFRLFGYAGLLVPPLALATGLLRLLGRNSRRVNRFLLCCANAVVLASACLSTVELLGRPMGSIAVFAGGFVGTLPFTLLILVAPIPLAIILQVTLTVALLAAAASKEVQRAVDAVSKQAKTMYPNLFGRSHT